MTINNQAIIVGVMGGSAATEQQEKAAYEIGKTIATAGAILLCGGGTGVMEAVAKGAAETGGLTIGVLPGASKKAANPFIHLAIPTSMGDARNAINVLASDIVIAIGGGAGTLSEIAMALKNGKTVMGFDTCKPAFSDGAKVENFVEYDSISELSAAVQREVNALLG